MVLVAVLGLSGGTAAALSRERWTNQQPYGFFFNDYGPNFYVGFVPREQDRKRITIHLGRGNQLRLRIVLSEQAIDSYLPDQVARHDLYKELIDKQVITLTTNTAWEAYEQRFAAEGSPRSPKKKGSVAARRVARAQPPHAHEADAGARLPRPEGPRPDARRLEDAARARASRRRASRRSSTPVNDLFPHRIDAYRARRSGGRRARRARAASRAAATLRRSAPKRRRSSPTSPTTSIRSRAASSTTGRSPRSTPPGRTTA